MYKGEVVQFHGKFGDTLKSVLWDTSYDIMCLSDLAAKILLKGVSAMSNGILGNMFDFDGNGELDIFEQSAEFAFLQKMIEDENDDEGEDNDDE